MSARPEWIQVFLDTPADAYEEAVAFWSAVTALAAVRATRRGGPVPDAAAAGGIGVRQAAGRRRPGRCAPRPRLDRPPGDRRAGRRPRCHGGLDLPRRRGDALPRRPGLLPHAARRGADPGPRRSDGPRPGLPRRPGRPLGVRGGVLVRADGPRVRRSAASRTSSGWSRTGGCGSCSSASTSPTGRSARTPTSPRPPRGRRRRRTYASARRSCRSNAFWTVLTAPGGQVYCLTDRDPATGRPAGV